MATYEQDIVMFDTKENGDKTIKMPISRVNNIEGIGRSINTAYLVNDVVYVDNNKKVALKCTTAGTTSSSELDVSSASIGSTITDGTVKWQVCNRTSDVTSVNGKTGDVVVDLPVGHTYWSVEHNVPAGRLPAMGATYNRALYADLWAWANSVGLVKTESEWQAIASANDGNCAYYSSGDGSTTFRVPKLPTTIASDVPTEVPVVGNDKGLGVLSQNGTERTLVWGSQNNSSQWVIPATIGQNFAYNDGSQIVLISKNPDKSGIVAKTSATKITGQWLIVAFGVAHNIGEADVANVMSAVEQVQTSVGTLEQGVGTLEQGVGTAIDYIVESYRNGTEWYEVYKSGKVRQGGIVNPGSTVTYLMPFKDTNYTLCASVRGTSSSTNNINWTLGTPRNKTATSFNAHGSGVGFEWIAEGQGA